MAEFSNDGMAKFRIYFHDARTGKMKGWKEFLVSREFIDDAFGILYREARQTIIDHIGEAIEVDHIAQFDYGLLRWERKTFRVPQKARVVNEPWPPTPFPTWPE